MQLAEVSGKIQVFPKKNCTFYEKIVFYPPKVLMTFFLVINSYDFQMFTLLLAKTTDNFLLLTNNHGGNVFFGKI